MSCVCENMKYNTLKEILKEKIREVTLQELYDLSFEFNEDTKYLPREYKKKYIESVLNVIINRFNSLKNTQENFEGEVTKKEASEINKILTKTITAISHLDGCLPTLNPNSSNTLNSLYFSFCRDSSGTEYTTLPPCSSTFSAASTPRTVFPLAVGIDII